MAETQATEAAQRKAQEAGIDLASVKGTGADGAVKTEDVEKAIAEREAAQAQMVSVVVNPRLDAVEYVAPDGRRFGNDAVQVSVSEYEALNSEKVGGYQPIVKEA
jgi:pyruvate/2-oxoglutarate dehydrogenase complex dihydrolipoamide acyltransferase (E2) component